MESFSSLYKVTHRGCGGVRVGKRVYITPSTPSTAHSDRISFLLISLGSISRNQRLSYVMLFRSPRPHVQELGFPSMEPMDVHKQTLSLALPCRGSGDWSSASHQLTLLLFPYTIHPVLIVCCSLGYFWPLVFHMSACNAMVTKLYFHWFSFHFSISI